MSSRSDSTNQMSNDVIAIARSAPNATRDHPGVIRAIPDHVLQRAARRTGAPRRPAARFHPRIEEHRRPRAKSGSTKIASCAAPNVGLVAARASVDRARCRRSRRSPSVWRAPAFAASSWTPAAASAAPDGYTSAM